LGKNNQDLRVHTDCLYCRVDQLLHGIHVIKKKFSFARKTQIDISKTVSVIAQMKLDR